MITSRSSFSAFCLWLSAVIACANMSRICPAEVINPDAVEYVQVDIFSPADTLSVPGGSTINWYVGAIIDPESTTLGLAGYLVDLVQSGPAPLNLQPGTRAAGLQKFDLPLGIANRPVAGSPLPSGFGGTLLPQSAHPTYKDLLQIGGLQNTCGLAGTGIATDTTILTGVAQQEGGILIASGSFIAPNTPGIYEVDMVNIRVNLLKTFRTPPMPSAVIEGTPFSANDYIIFQVICIADHNHSNTVTVNDIFSFLSAWFAGNSSADANSSGTVTVNDIFFFLSRWFAGC